MGEPGGNCSKLELGLPAQSANSVGSNPEPGVGENGMLTAAEKTLNETPDDIGRY